MRIQFLSDIHIEHHHDGGASFIGGLDSEGVDLLVVAGDTCSHPQIPLAFPALCAQYPRVLAVAGNHEYYGSDFDRVRELFEEARRETSNLSWLENEGVEIDGQRFLGTTLWFPDGAGNALHKGSLNDFRCIRGFEDEVYERNERAVRFLRDELREGDVVLTHHLPSTRSVPAVFEGSALNRFFLTPMDELIVERRPKLWLHGHSHHSCDYRLGETRILCNPYGYAGLETNPEFQVKLLLDLTGAPSPRKTFPPKQH